MIARDVNTPFSLASAMWLGIVGASVLLILPVFVWTLVEERGLSDATAGWIGSADLIGYALSSFVAFRTVRRYRWRRIVLTGLALMTLGNLLSIVSENFWILFASRIVLSGFGAGLVITVVYTLLGDTDKPERNAGLYWTVNVLGGAAGLLIVPRVTAMFGTTGLFAFLAITAVSAIPVTVLWLPDRGISRVQNENAGPVTSPVLLILAGIAVFNFGMGGVWAFVQRIGATVGIEATVLGSILSGTYLVSMLGSAVASWQGSRLGYVGPYAMGLAIMTAALVMLIQGSGISIFILALAMMNFSWNYAMTYQFSAVFFHDTRGRMSVFIILVQASGLMLGPAAAGYLIEGAGYGGALWMGLTGCAVSLILFVVPRLWAGRRK